MMKKIAKKVKKKVKTTKNRTRKPGRGKLLPSERESLRGLLVAHFGSPRIDKAILGIRYVKELDKIYIDLESLMLREVALAEKDAEDYFKQIKKDYQSVGRPGSAFNWEELKYLCSISCTLPEIAGFFNVAKQTVKDKILSEFGETWEIFYEKNSQGAKVSLRRSQLRNAIVNDNATMQKFLGVNMLGQKQKIEFEGEVKVNSWVDLMNNLENEVDNDKDLSKTLDGIKK